MKANFATCPHPFECALNCKALGFRTFRRSVEEGAPLGHPDRIAKFREATEGRMASLKISVLRYILVTFNMHADP